MKIAVIIARILLGLVFVVFGLNVFHPFIPGPLPPGDAGVMMGLMFKHGWFTFFGVLYILAGLLILIGRFVPIGLVILGPILVNIVLFHVSFHVPGLAGASVFVVLEIFLIYAYREHFKALFTPGWIR